MNTKNSCRLTAGWLLDGSGGAARRRVRVEIVGDRIVSIESAAGAPVRPAATIDCSSDTVLPCLVDSHVHLFMSGTTDPAAREAQLAAEYDRARTGIEARIGRHVACGVLAARDGGDSRGHTLRYRMEDRDPRFSGFVLRAAGRAWRKSGRYGKLIGRPPEPGKTLADSIAAAEDADHVKIVNSGLNSLLSFGKTTSSQFSNQELAAAVRAAGSRGWKVMVHANGPQPVRSAVEAGCHSIEHGFFMGADNLKRMADRGAVWVPTAVTMKAYAESLPAGSREAAGAARNLEHQLAQIARGRELGVSIAVGSDAGSLNVHHGSGCIEEMKLLCAAGFSTEEAVFCASAAGAKLLGIEERIGRLAPGRPASFLVCPGGPDRLPESLHRLKAVYVAGAPVFTTSNSKSISSKPPTQKHQSREQI